MIEFLSLSNIKYNTTLMAENTYLSTEEVAKLLNVHSNRLAAGSKAASFLQPKLAVSTASPEKPLRCRTSGIMGHN
jgi:hypothetical protein